MKIGRTSVRARGSSVRNGLLTGEANQSRSPPWSLWNGWPQLRWKAPLVPSQARWKKLPLGAAGVTTPVLKGSVPTTGGGGAGMAAPAVGGRTVSGAWARKTGSRLRAGVTTGRPRATAGAWGVLATTWRARSTAGGALVGRQP